MSPDPALLTTVICNETGLGFVGTAGFDDEGYHWIRLIPEDHDPAHTFIIKVLIGWRRLTVKFEPGKFAGPLLEAMSTADANAKSVFKAVMQDCKKKGATILIRLNGIERQYDDPAVWIEPWSRLRFEIRKGNIELGAEDGTPDIELVNEWTSRFVAAVVALLPLEEYEPPGTEGLPEGAVQKVEVNRYERDRRNRSAALAIHGCSCLACGMSFEETYGATAAGFIEVHHVVPVSEVGEDYIIDPQTDLVPLCSNCHSVAHRRSPPFKVEEIASLLRSNN